MKTFTVIIEETLRREVKIRTKNKDAAIDEVMEDYYEEGLVLDASDFAGVEFIAK